MVRDFARENIFYTDRGSQIVGIIAYCLMPNHFHILMKSEISANRTKFMRKLCTGYSMYYNKKYRHSGTIFQGKYKSKLVADEHYFNVLLNYIHLNPYSLKKDTPIEHADFTKAFEYSKNYEFSSLKDYLQVNREQNSILAEVRPT